MTLKTPPIASSRMDGKEDVTSATKSQKITRDGGLKEGPEELQKLAKKSEAGSVAPAAKESGQSGNRKKSGEPLEKKDGVPLVRVHVPTPSPRPPAGVTDDDEKKERTLKRRKTKEEIADGLDDDDEFEEDGDEEGEEEEDVEEEEEEETDMTQEEKKAMYESVLEGDIDVLEDCLDLPNADINMVWFQENLLMAAMRAGHVDVCEFLLDNGVDHTFSTSIVDMHDTPTGKVMERYEVNCRQMAYDRDLQDIVFLIDTLQENVFPFIPKPQRTPRFRRPKLVTPDDSEADESDDEISSSSDVIDASSDTESKKGRQSGANTPSMNEEKKKKKKKRKRQKKANSRVSSALEGDGGIDDDDDGIRTTTVDEEDGEKDKTFRTLSTFGDVDSGNYSMASSKLKKNMLERHDKLLEKEDRKEQSGSPSVGSPRKSENDSTQTRSQSKKSKGDKSDRTSTTFTHYDESQSMSGPTESIVPSLKTEIPEWAAILNAPSNRIRSNKAALAARQGNLTRNFHSSPLHASSTEQPLQWRKISSPGSYARESKRWHLETKIAEASSETVQISQLKLAPTIPSSSVVPTAVSDSSLLNPKPSKSKRKLTPPSDISDSISIASMSISDRLDRFKAQKPVSKTSSSPAPNSPAMEVASYMRPTKSTITKQRLGPQFVESYGGLDFQATPTPSNSGNFSKGILKSSRKSPASSGSISFSYKVPVLNAKSVSQRRNQNVISHRL